MSFKNMCIEIERESQKIINPKESSHIEWKDAIKGSDKIELIKDMTHSWGRYKWIYAVTKDNQTKTYLVD